MMFKLKTILVDDEPSARMLLRNLIEEHCPMLEVIDTADSVQNAVKLILNHKIDLVFLDIEMPNENGFALFEYFKQPTFETIFTTAYSDYALKAFEVSAVDYILKPISVNKLIMASEKVYQMNLKQQLVQRVETLKENMTVSQLQKIALPLSDGLVFIKIEDILYFEADGSYTNVITKDQKILISKKLKDFDDLLNEDKRFYRVHRSYLINIQHIKKYNKKDGSNLIFENQTMIPVAREKKAEFDDFISNLSV